MAEDASQPSKADQPETKKTGTGPGLFSIVLLPLLPFRLMFRWMFRDPNIRGELLGAVIVASLVAISAATAYFYGDAEDRRLDKELRLQTQSARYQTQLDALKAFSDGIPKNITYVTRRKNAALQASVGPIASQQAASRQDLLDFEQELTREWLQTVDHYTSVCRGVRASFTDSAVIDAVTGCEAALETLKNVETDADRLRRAAETLGELLDAAGLSEQEHANQEANLTTLVQYVDAAMRICENDFSVCPPEIPELDLEGLSQQQRSSVTQHAWLYRASTIGYSVAAIIAQAYYGTALDAMTNELRSFDQSLLASDQSD